MTVRAGVLVGLLLAQSLAWQARAAGEPGGGTSAADRRRSAPGFSEKDIFGRATIALRSYRGKVVLLNFWATWCLPCRGEIPALEELHGSHDGKVVVIGASVFSSARDTEAFFRDHRVNYPMFYGSYALMEKYDRVATIPTTFVIDQKGEIAAKVVGARSREEYEDLVSPLLEP
jgi:thiol-disulfide isomerase/thioredoxin